MGSSIDGVGFEDGKLTAAGMPSFVSSTTVVQNNSREGNTTQRISDFGVLEQSITFHIGSASGLLYPAVTVKHSGQSINSDPSQFGVLGKQPIASTEIAPSAARVESLTSFQHKEKLHSLISFSSGQFENWGESMADASPRTDTSTDVDTDDKNQRLERGQLAFAAASDSSDRSKDKTLDQKTLRRLAQNREAARKSRLRKKAYVQQLESSRLKLTQLEQELQKARHQGIFISNSGDQSHATGGNGALTFDVEYARWLEEHNRQISELRAAVNAHASENDLRVIVDGVMAHYDEIFRLKGIAAKADVFHILSGMWKTPAERCFLWLGGFRSSELLKVQNLIPYAFDYLQISWSR
ncbi:transcription factor TGAL1-like isoform X9 [Musa acuminata AAA Group]|uniref:transcription factor TGAL1-like isoform X9 n=1 Tax=Musa acuminata AAA Group TaxID=214697 RepID=UPI0031CFFCFE